MKVSDTASNFDEFSGVLRVSHFVRFVQFISTEFSLSVHSNLPFMKKVVSHRKTSSLEDNGTLFVLDSKLFRVESNYASLVVIQEVPN